MLLLQATAQRRSPAALLLDLLTGVQHLYFLGVLAQLTLLLALVRRLRPGASAGRLLAISAAVSLLTLACSDLALWSRSEGLVFTEGWLRRLCLPWAAFFFFGVWMRERHPRWATSSGKLAALAAGAAAAFLLYEWGFRLEERSFGWTPRTELLLAGWPFQLLAAWLLLALMGAWRRSLRLRAPLAALAAAARDSYGIYVVHFPVLIVLYGAWRASGSGSPHWAEVPTFLVLTLLASSGLVRALRALPLPVLRLVLLGEPAATTRRGRRAPLAALPDEPARDAGAATSGGGSDPG